MNQEVLEGRMIAHRRILQLIVCELASTPAEAAAQAKAATDERYAQFDARRRIEEARRAEIEEADDLRALTEIEHRRDDPDHA